MSEITMTDIRREMDTPQGPPEDENPNVLKEVPEDQLAPNPPQINVKSLHKSTFDRSLDDVVITNELLMGNVVRDMAKSKFQREQSAQSQGQGQNDQDKEIQKQRDNNPLNRGSVQRRMQQFSNTFTGPPTQKKPPNHNKNTSNFSQYANMKPYNQNQRQQSYNNQNQNQQPQQRRMNSNMSNMSHHQQPQQNRMPSNGSNMNQNNGQNTNNQNGNNPQQPTHHTLGSIAASLYRSSFDKKLDDVVDTNEILMGDVVKAMEDSRLRLYGFDSNKDKKRHHSSTESFVPPAPETTFPKMKVSFNKKLHTATHSGDILMDDILSDIAKKEEAFTGKGRKK